MIRYAVRRLIHGAFLLLGVSLLSFMLFALAPGEFFDEMRLDPRISRATVSALRAKYGLDQPLPVKYLYWLQSVIRGDFGYSFAYNRPAASLLWGRARNTLLLTGTAMVLAWLIAVPLGVWSAARPGKWGDRLCSAGLSALLALPDLVLALGLLLFAVRTGILPVGGMVSPEFAELGMSDKVKDVISHFFLPVSALVLSALPLLVRHVRTGMVEVLVSPFIRAARAHGIPNRRVLFRYALPAAANPLISLLGFSVATLLSVSLLVEVIMSWPGLGPLLLEAILARDLFVVIGAVMFSTVFLIFGNLLADMLLYLADPRIRTE